MMNELPNEIVNLILSFREISPTCKIMRKSIYEQNELKKNYTKRTRYNCYYFHSIIRYKIDEIVRLNRYHKTIIKNPYEVVEDELWMLDYFHGDYDVSMYSSKKRKIPFKNMDFTNGYRSIKLTNQNC